MSADEGARLRERRGLYSLGLLPVRSEHVSDVAQQRRFALAAGAIPAGRPKDHHAVRQACEATLDVSAMAVELARSSNFAPGSPPSLKVHVVTVMERDCPEGDEPIAWYLVTNEPIATPEQVAAVVDVYALGRRRALQGAHERQPDREAPDGELRGIAR
jgi:hypothetical protein